MKNMKIAQGIVILLFLHTLLVAQTPNRFNYQAVIRDESGELVIDQNISIQLSILEGSESGSSIYTETHSVSSNSYGIINLKIGDGDPSGIAFADIVWNGTSKFIKVEADITGNTNYTCFRHFSRAKNLK